MLDGIHTALASLETRMDRRFEAIDRRFDGVDRRFDAIDGRFTGFEESVDRRFSGVEQRFDAFDAKVSRQFTWLVGIQVTTLAAMVAAILAR